MFANNTTLKPWLPQGCLSPCLFLQRSRKIYQRISLRVFWLAIERSLFQLWLTDFRNRLTSLLLNTPSRHCTMQIFYNEVFKLYGLPKYITCDLDRVYTSYRDKVFTSSFRSELYQLYGIQLQLSLAYHLQIDQQIKWVNESLISIVFAAPSPMIGRGGFHGQLTST